MATIENRGNYQFRAKVRKRGHKTITKTFNNRRDAEAWARSVEAEYDRKGFLPSLVAHQMTFRQAGERYREEVFPRLANKGKTENARLLRLIDKFGELALASLDSSHAAQFRDLRLKEGASPQTVKHEIGLLGRILKQCVIDWGIPLPKGIATAQIRKPTLPPGRDRRLRAGEEERLLAAARASKCREIESIIIIALETAARRGEIAAMRWEDIDLKKRTWHIPKTKTLVPRTIPLSQRAGEILHSLPRRIDGGVWRLRREDGITQAFDRLCKSRVKKEGGIKIVDKFPNLRFHDLRHEATSRLFEKGLNIMEVASITGHKDLRSLQRYTHLKAEDLAEKLG
ncbi:MAG: site-specific integrase [Desulfobulbaceae bacterium]